MSVKYQCPVCYYGEMRLPPRDEFICPCCGTEFGVADLEMSHAELQEQWMVGGLKWFSQYTPPPKGWDPIAQLLGEPPPETEERITEPTAPVREVVAKDDLVPYFGDQEFYGEYIYFYTRIWM